MSTAEFIKWYELNKGLLASFVRKRESLLSAVPVLNDSTVRDGYVLLGLSRDLSGAELRELGLDFEEVFPGVSYATENVAPDPFWDVPFPEPDPDESAEEE